MGGSENTNKRLVVYDQRDKTKWIVLDTSESQIWELEQHESDWDGLESFFRQSTTRTLYRVPGNHWVLVEQTTHYEAGCAGIPTFRVLTDREAAEQLLLSGHTPPDDVIHFVSDKLVPPPPAAAIAEPPAANDGEDLRMC